ncbi:hypothetical protein NEFER03_0741 [Nematocida sp. LUAm3]|nr:hypothetical protein NEFER03_0741 [Nematocida sp. LUAm3]KAI5175200.1 hypothetical protein NEFER02_1161 [Nematocida sp. LUAm2]KAI5178128.1 hypothetical protein NEFER01_1306 [Nematocida sp. LUAm1]
MAKHKEESDLLNRINSLPLKQLQKEKSRILLELIHSSCPEEQKLKLRMLLQKKLLHPEETNRAAKELKETETSLDAQCALSSSTSKKLAESDAKLSRVKSTQEKLSLAMEKAEQIIQKRRKKEKKEDFLLITSLLLFLIICIYVVIKRVIL